MSKILATTALSMSLLALTSTANASQHHRHHHHRHRHHHSHNYHNAADLKLMLSSAAQRHGISPRIAWAVLKVESSGDCNAVSYAGAVGVMQVKPATAREVGVGGNLKDCKTGIEAGVAYLKKALQKYTSLCSALSAYNIGLYGGGACTGYGRKVMRVANAG